jgi:RNA polymerase sigma-70 factor (ECF subfamily)
MRWRSDHVGVIQSGGAGVSTVMACVVQSCDLVVPAMWPSLRTAVGAWRRSSAMSVEDQSIADPWARLIEAVARERDRAAFAQLFGHFAPRVKTFMLRSGAGEASAEEVAQETLLTVWRKAALFDPSSAGASAWIFTIARNLRIDAVRRERRGRAHETSDIDAEFLVDDRPRADTALAASQAEARVRTALAALPEEQMRCIELSFYQEKAHGEIARLLGIPLGTVKSRLRLAMDRLRSLLGEPA